MVESGLKSCRVNSFGSRTLRSCGEPPGEGAGFKISGAASTLAYSMSGTNASCRVVEYASGVLGDRVLVYFAIGMEPLTE